MTEVTGLEAKLKILADLGLFGLRRLSKWGNSFGLVVPKDWLNLECLLIGETYWVTLEQQGTAIVVHPVTEKELQEILKDVRITS